MLISPRNLQHLADRVAGADGAIADAFEKRCCALFFARAFFFRHRFGQFQQPTDPGR